MSGFMSVPAELREAAARVDELANEVAGDDLARPLADAARAVPGGQAAPAVGSLTSELGSWMRRWVTWAHDLGDALTQVAASVEAADAAAERRFRGKPMPQ